MNIKLFFSVIVMLLLSTNISLAKEITANLKATEGVTSAYVRLIDKQAIISFDPMLTSMTDLKLVITNTRVKEYIYTINSVTIKE